MSRCLGVGGFLNALGCWEPGVLWREDSAKTGLGLDLPRGRAVSPETHTWMTRLGPLTQPSQPWPLWETPGGHRVELGVQVWSDLAPDLPGDLKMDTVVAGLCAFQVCD